MPAIGAHHADGLAHQGGRCAPAGHSRPQAHHALDAGGQPQAEARQEGGQRAARDEGQDDQGEDLEGVALGVVDEVAQEALELLVGAGEEVGPGGPAVGACRGAVLVCNVCVLVYFYLPKRGGGGENTPPPKKLLVETLGRPKKEARLLLCLE